MTRKSSRRKPKTTTGVPVGETLTDVRPMTDAEMRREGWYSNGHWPPVALVFSCGTVMYPSRDPEGNGPGELFGVDPAGTTFAVREVKDNPEAT
jgi:hypothetical protein